MIGCGYVFVKWSATGNRNDEMCGISRFYVIFSYGNTSDTKSTSMIMYNFTGLPDDTLFNVTVVGINLRDDFIDLDFISMRAMIIESMYVHFVNTTSMHIHTCSYLCNSYYQVNNC